MEIPEPPPRPRFTPGRCNAGVTACGKPARLYPSGWRCVDCAPGARKEGKR